MTPDQVHFGQAEAIYAARQETLDTCVHQHAPSASFRQGHPGRLTSDLLVWINPQSKRREGNQA